MSRVPAFSAMRRRLAVAAPAALALLLGGCNLVVFDPSGDIAQQEGDLLVIATALMLLIIVPVMVLTVFFAWRYRASNPRADYRPDWDRSHKIQAVTVLAPLAIIIALATITWVSTHRLDPYRPLSRIAPGRPVAEQVRPLEIQVVSLDWKWLFIYPEQGIATVNTLALPVDRPIRFRLTSSHVMNAFYVPELAGMIYTMPGMETKLHAVLNNPGRFGGISANYSGAGFSDMHFAVEGMDGARFDRWAAGLRGGGRRLDGSEYSRLEAPSESVPAIVYASVAPGLFDRIVQGCVAPGQACMADTMRADMQRRRDVDQADANPVHQAGSGLADAHPTLIRNDVPTRPGIAPAAKSQGQML